MAGYFLQVFRGIALTTLTLFVIDAGERIAVPSGKKLLAFGFWLLAFGFWQKMDASRWPDWQATETIFENSAISAQHLALGLCFEAIG